MDLSTHIAILQAALGDGLRVGRVALRAITLANCLTDLYQWRAELHFDNAPDRAAIYALWRRGLYAQVAQAVALSAPTPGAATHPRNWRRALWAFGRATHILQDFYAHTNWVELAVERGQWQAIAPLHAPDCAAHDLPAGLTSGYFSLRYAAPWQQFSGCPACDGQFVPPPGFAYCHAQLAKDSRAYGHGRDEIMPGGVRYGELAARQAARATAVLWDALCQQIVAAYHRPPHVDGIALVRRLAWGPSS